MSDKDDKKKKKKKGSAPEPRTGPVQPPLDGAFSKWIESKFMGGESVTSIDVYPLYPPKCRDREMRLYHYDVRANEKVGAERSVELANVMVSECQMHCDAHNKGERKYEVVVIDERRGGQANPVGHQKLVFSPRVSRPAPKEGDDAHEEPETEALTARKLMLESVKLIHEKDRFQQDNEGKIVGDILLAEMTSNKVLMGHVNTLMAGQMALLKDYASTLKELSNQAVEMRAVGIDEANAHEDQLDRQKARERDGIWSDVTKAAMMEAVKQVGNLFPTVGAAFLAHMGGSPAPETPRITDGKKPDAAEVVVERVPEEKIAITAFIEAAEAEKADATHTVAEKLFGRDGDPGTPDAGKPLEAGVFTRAQVAVLNGVHAHGADVATLDVLLPDSGHRDAVTPQQMIAAIAHLTPGMMGNLTKFMALRKAARDKKPN